MTDNGKTILEMTGIVKDFPGTRALDGVDFDLREGEVHALIGENGAGKSTLMNVLAGRFSDYKGRVMFDGREIRLNSPRQVLGLGIAVIYQELSILPNLTVAENIMLGHEPRGRLPGTLDRPALRKRAAAVVDRLGFDLPLDEPVGNLGHARQCLVEVARAIQTNARAIVFDEPTACLGGEDVEKLFADIRELKSKGIGIVYISHRLDELSRIADRVTVLRDGKVIDTRPVAECTIADLSRMMLGRDLKDFFPAKTNTPGETVLRVEDLTRTGVFENISFELRKGEIFGIAGLVGSGRTEIVRALIGADRSKGRCEIAGKTFTRRSPRRCGKVGIGMIHEDKKRDGVIPGRSVGVNLGIGILKRLSGVLGFLRRGKIRENAVRMIDRMQVVPRPPEKEIQLLSGGNQQKVIVGRCLCADPEVLVFDEPTQGIDVGTKAQIYKLIVDLAREGRGIVLISSEFEEIVNLADRILILREGRAVREVPAAEIDADTLFNECRKKTA